MLTKTNITILVVTVALFAFAVERELPGDYSPTRGTHASIKSPVPPFNFKWSMPKRFGPKTAENIVNYHWKQDSRTYEDTYVRPATWKVDFDACSPAMPGNSIYKWDVDGVMVSSPNLTVCTFAHEFASQGTYAVKLTITAPDGAVTIADSPVTVKDLLIVSIGDSFASGQGNPDIPRKGSAPAKWVDKLCARSAFAGPAQAALSIEEADPHTSITFISFACTGARITNGLLEPQMRGSIKLEPQMKKLREALKGRNIDALLISIGGNDLGFADLVARCIVDLNCSKDNKALKQLRDGLEVLPARYLALNEALIGLQPAMRVFITEYPDMVRNERGELCHRDPWNEALVRMTKDETGWASEEVIRSLNTQVSEAAKRHGWSYVDGVFERFRNHGYCATETQRWVRTFKDARRIQGVDNEKCESLRFNDLRDCLVSSGSLHPNGGGHATYGARLIEELRRAHVTAPPVP